MCPFVRYHYQLTYHLKINHLRPDFGYLVFKQVLPRNHQFPFLRLQNQSKIGLSLKVLLFLYSYLHLATCSKVLDHDALLREITYKKVPKLFKQRKFERRQETICLVFKVNQQNLHSRSFRK